jgi:glycosyltransferase involved in cell wall biosynthesis
MSAFVDLSSHLSMKRKVLIIVQNQSVPPDTRVLQEARALRAHGYDVTVLSPRRKEWSRGYEIVEGIRIYRHPTTSEGSTPRGYLWEYGWSLFWEFVYTWWIYLWHGFDVIEGCNPPDNIAFVALPFKFFGVKYIFDHHDTCPELYTAKGGEKGALYKVLLWLEKVTYRLSDVVMVTNGTYKDLAIKRGGRSADDVFIVRNGPNPETLKPVPPNAGLKNGKRYLVGYVGCMNYQDGLDILVEVAEYIKNLGRTDVGFVCVGSGPELPGLRQMIKDRDMADTVSFTGRIPDAEMLEALSTADVCVNPDRPCEMNDISTMIKIMEYMALGKPIVQFDVKEGRVSAQKASLYARTVDPIRSFAEELLWLMDRPEERKMMGELGRKRVETELAWEHSVPNLLAAYDRVLNRSGREAVKAPAARIVVPPAADVDRGSTEMSYVLVTPARNEGTFLEKTIEAVIHQTVLPLKWVIVDDGSTDNTAEIVKRYLPHYPWMELVQISNRRDRNFAGKVGAFNAGFEKVKDLRWEIIGNLDGDISFGRDHFEFLIGKFSADATLGVAGTVFKEEGYSSDRDSFEGCSHVAGACQLFRRKCWEDVGGYVPHRAGGIDWMAVVTARMKGWKTESFREKWFFHYRRLGTAERRVLSSLFSYGQKDYYLGGHPVWELFRVAYRMTKQPFITGALALGLGYCWAFLRRAPRRVSRELMAFHRKEQMAKLRAIVKSLVRFKHVDNFTLAQD